MIKAYMLQKYVSREELEDLMNWMLKTRQDIIEQDKYTGDAKKVADDIVENATKILNNNPEGRWETVFGRVSFRQFLAEASDYVKKNPDKDYRVIEGMIEDNAYSWLGYKDEKVRPSLLEVVLRNAR